MADNGSPNLRPPHRGGGVFVAFGLVGGAIVGILAGEPSLGLLSGLGLGVLAAIILVLRDRR